MHQQRRCLVPLRDRLARLAAGTMPRVNPILKLPCYEQPGRGMMTLPIVSKIPNTGRLVSLG